MFVIEKLDLIGDKNLPDQIVIFFNQKGLQSTVRLRFRKSISRHNFQNRRKFDDNDFRYHRNVINSV